MGVEGVGVAFAGRRFGVGGDAMAEEIARRGGVGRMKGDDYDKAASVVESIQGRRISAEERENSKKGGKYGNEMDRVTDTQGRVTNFGLDAVKSGEASKAANEQLNTISGPEQAAMSAAFKAALDESTAMHEVAATQNKLVAWLQNHFDVTLKGSLESRANLHDKEAFASLGSGTSHAAPHEAAAESGAHH